MRGLADQDLLELWEHGQQLSPGGRARLIVETGCPTWSSERIGSLTIGQRDQLVAGIRARTFGGEVESVSACPACRAQVEIQFDSVSLFPRGVADREVGHKAVQRIVLEEQGLVVQAEIPTIRDLEQAVALASPLDRPKSLLDSCVVAIERQGVAVAITELSDQLRDRLEAGLAEADPLSEVYVAVQCPSCRHEWRLLFDVAGYFWHEIHRHARKLLEEVHLLAAAYGWREADILAMTPTRRDAYLQMVGA